MCMFSSHTYNITSFFRLFRRRSGRKMKLREKRDVWRNGGKLFFQVSKVQTSWTSFFLYNYQRDLIYLMLKVFHFLYPFWPLITWANVNQSISLSLQIPHCVTLDWITVVQKTFWETNQKILGPNFFFYRLGLLQNGRRRNVEYLK